LYTGLGPVCGITMRRGTGTTAFAPLVDSAAIVPTEPAAPAGTRGAAEACSVVAAAGVAASATGATPVASGLTAIFSSRAAGAAGGFATPAGGGATTIIGRVATTAPAGALATTGPTGGREAMAGVAGGGATIGGAERGCGTILRGSGLAGIAAAGFAATTGAAGCAGASGLVGATTVAFAVPRGWRASSSSSFFLASRAFITSPGLEMFDRSILGTIASAPWRPVAAPACVVCCDFRAKCARTFSASSSSSELECVLPPETPTSGRTSRIARDFTSSSFARSLIRTLLIRLFSMCAAKWPLKIHRSPMARFRFLVRCQNTCCCTPDLSPTRENPAQLTRRLLRLQPPPRLQPLQLHRRSFPPRLLPQRFLSSLCP
jgi:hypothetical protein